MEDGKECKTSKQRVVCCIGDIHGHFNKLQNLWSNLETRVHPSDFYSALIILLGDCCDRGFDTPKVLDFLISLPSKYPQQTHVFLCGNHDFAFAAFLGVLPAPADGYKFSDIWSEYEELTEDSTIVVSGDHGKLYTEGLRLIIDECDGLEHNPIAAVVLSSLAIIRDTDELKQFRHA